MFTLRGLFVNIRRLHVELAVAYKTVFFDFIYFQR